MGAQKKRTSLLGNSFPEKKISAGDGFKNKIKGRQTPSLRGKRRGALGEEIDDMTKGF